MSWLKQHHPDIVRILRLTKYEIEGQMAHLAGKLSPRQRGTLRQLGQQRGLKLNIASGGTAFPGWISLDVTSRADIRMDLRRPIPLQDGAAALIFCEHFCDHLAYPAGIGKFLADCHRLLEPGGRARFVMHEAQDLARAYLDKDDRYFDIGGAALPTRIEAVNMLFRFNDFHQFIYDYELFSSLLSQAGFSRIIRCAYRQSENPDIVMDYVQPGREMLSMYIEAVK